MKKSHASLLFLSVCFIAFLWLAIEANSFPAQARHFPFYIAVLAGVLTLIALVQQIIEVRKSQSNELFHENIGRVLRYMGWIIGFIVAIYLIGLILAAVLYLLLFLFIEAKIGILKTIAFTAVTITAMFLITNFMDLNWPSSLLNLF